MTGDEGFDSKTINAMLDQILAQFVILNEKFKVANWGLSHQATVYSAQPPQQSLPHWVMACSAQPPQLSLPHWVMACSTQPPLPRHTARQLQAWYRSLPWSRRRLPQPWSCRRLP